MSNRYDVEKAVVDASYSFKTSSGTTYLAYFTEFILLNPDESELTIVSFGFARDNTNDIQQHDSKVKQTIIYIIKEFFQSQPDNAVLYMCMDNDKKARNRHITFSRWFREVENDFEKHNFVAKEHESGFYGSLILKASNPEKKKLIEAFYFTIHYWGLQ